jgi:cytoskeleton protein RodZ
MAGTPLQRLQRKEIRLLPGESRKPRSAVGDLLRQRRVARGLGLRDVADHIRIRANHLEAIESGRFEDLPGRTYAIGFVRSYAEWLDLDGDDIIRQFRDEAAGLSDATALVFPSPAPEGKVPGGPVLAIGLVLAAAIYGGWFMLSTRNMAVADLVPEVPERLGQWLAERRAAFVAAPIAGTPPQDAERPVARAEPISPVASSAASASVEERAPEPPVARPVPVPEPPAPIVRALPTAPSGTDIPPAAPASPSTAVAPAPAIAVVPAPAAVALPAPPSTTTGRPAEVASRPAAPVSPPREAASAEPNAAEDDDSEETSTPPPETTTADTSIAAVPAVPVSRASDAANPVDSNSTRPPAVASLPQATRVPSLPSATATPDASGARIVIRATDESWVQVRDADRNPIMTRVLARGDVYRVPNRPGLTLQAGNAGALEILVDGLAVPSIGPVGSVRRDVLLEPDRLRAGAILNTDR